MVVHERLVAEYGFAGLEPLASLLAGRHADLTVAAQPLTGYTHAANQRENP
jgi:hypothetical protein